MRTTVKIFWIAMLLILICCISGKAFNFAQESTILTHFSNTSASLSPYSSTFNVLEQAASNFDDTRFSWTTDVELGAKPISETYLSNQQRLRRAIEDNLFLRNIFLILSNHEDLLVHGWTKQYNSGKDPDYALTGSDYYIFTLRRILI